MKDLLYVAPLGSVIVSLNESKEYIFGILPIEVPQLQNYFIENTCIPKWEITKKDTLQLFKFVPANLTYRSAKIFQLDTSMKFDIPVLSIYFECFRRLGTKTQYCLLSR